jgi:hypothetical protein
LKVTTDENTTVAVGDGGECFQMYRTGTATTFNLPAEPMCDTTAGYGKVFCFKNRNVSNRFTIVPAAGDIIAAATLAAQDAGVGIRSGGAAIGDGICLVGSDVAGTDYWTDITYDGTWEVIP